MDALQSLAHNQVNQQPARRFWVFPISHGGHLGIFRAMKLISAFLAGTCIAAPCLANAPGTLIRYKFKVGQALTYRLNMNMTMAGGPTGNTSSTMEMVYRQTVLKVAPNGTATLRSHFISSHMSVGGKPMANGNTPKQDITIQMTPSGNLVGGNPMGSMFGPGGGGNITAGLPLKPVSVGSTWNTQMMNGMISLHSKLESLGNANGHTMAQIHSTGSMDMSKLFGAIAKGAGKGMSMSGTMYLDMRTAFDVTAGRSDHMTMTSKSTVHISGGPSGQMNMNTKQTMTMALVR